MFYSCIILGEYFALFHLYKLCRASRNAKQADARKRKIHVMPTLRFQTHNLPVGKPMLHPQATTLNDEVHFKSKILYMPYICSSIRDHIRRSILLYIATVISQITATAKICLISLSNRMSTVESDMWVWSIRIWCYTISSKIQGV